MRSAFWIKGNGQRRHMNSSNGACPEGGVARADFKLVEIKKTEGLAS